ncbi:hypothetical protein FA15DRAFT_670992 [Coprinopsis marcescibilis]|uniref:Uncharacterized protein n=1 Tax=Coprinopsis marcescibilis TaxID=230819 RepID=A0A5C3KR98_COPMA|nr:hypothetical protein FA15DRAFT_670992 [Coprinopsis marcescibilis]
MNSPEPISPSSTPSSGTPPNEEINLQSYGGSAIDKGFLSTITSHLSGFTGQASGNSSSSKRRLPGGTSVHFNSSSNRDSKTRRRENSSRAGTGEWEGGPKGPGGKREKDELLDQGLVEFLRKEIGDPFQDPRP